MLEINSASYIKPKKILVDGNEWEMRAPGAGDELALNQAQRRSKLLDQKIESGEATQEDYDLYDRLEAKMIDIFERMFRDTTPDNSQVKAWINNTPLVVIQLAIEDIQRQSEAKQDSSSDGAEEEVSRPQA